MAADPFAMPRLELGDSDPDFDEAVIIIDGREEETITIACPGARELAEKLIRLVNAMRPRDEAEVPCAAGPGA